MQRRRVERMDGKLSRENREKELFEMKRTTHPLDLPGDAELSRNARRGGKARRRGGEKEWVRGHVVGFPAPVSGG